MTALATVIVTGVGGPAGRALATMLVERGLEVVGTDIDLKGVHLPGIEVRRVPPARDPRFLVCLARLAEVTRADLVVPTVSEELVPLAASAPRWDVPVVVGEAGAVATADDKWLTCLRLARAGVPVPAHALTGGGGAAARLGLPVLTKPRIGRGARGVSIHRSLDEARRAGDGLLLQEFLPGTEYAVALHMGGAGPDALVVLEKTALAGGAVGNAVAVRRVDAPDVARVARAAVQALGLAGPADVDVRRRADGTPAVLEVNARVGAGLRDAPEVVDALLAAHLPRAPAAAIA